MNTPILTAVVVGSDNPQVVAAALREFAGRVDRGEVGPGQEGTSTEECSGCGETVVVTWSIGVDEDEEQDDGTMEIDTPFGKARVVPLGELPDFIRNALVN